MSNKYCTGGCKTKDLVFHGSKTIKDIDSSSTTALWICKRCGKKF